MAKKKKKMEFETMQVKLPHVKGLSIVLPVIYILWVAVMYYLLLPALNIHSRGLWLFVLAILKSCRHLPILPENVDIL